MKALNQKEKNELSELVAKIRSSKATQREFNRAAELNDRAAAAQREFYKNSSGMMMGAVQLDSNRSKK